MDNITLEQVESLADQLSADEQKQLVDHLTRKAQNGIAPVNPSPRQPVDLYGIWKGAFPENFDIDAALHDIRHEWEKEWPEVFGQ
jgi:hypothetical protein